MLNNLTDLTLDRRADTRRSAGTRNMIWTRYGVRRRSSYAGGLDRGPRCGAPGVVQWLPLARRREGVQPVRRAAAVRQPRIRRALVRDGYARRFWSTSCSSSGRSRRCRWTDLTVSTTELLSAFDVDHIGTEALLFQTGYLTITGEERLGGQALYRLGYPNREVRQSLNHVLLRHLVQGTRSARRGTACGRWRACLRHTTAPRSPPTTAGAVPRLLREHPVRMAHQQRHRELRGLLRERVLLVLRGAGIRDRRRGVEQPRPAGHGRAHGRARVPVRVQGGRDVAAGIGPCPVAGAGLRGQVPRQRRADPPDRRGVQPPTRNVTAFEVADG